MRRSWALKLSIDYSTTMKTIPRLNNHGAGCKNHSNWMLDCDFSNPEDRETMIHVLDQHISALDRDIKREKKTFAAQV